LDAPPLPRHYYKYIRDASQYAPRIVCLCVAHIAICATNANLKIQKKLKIGKNHFFENHKNQNNLKKLSYFNFFRILSHEEHFQITPNFLTSR
jgi:hypothetical protein